MDTGTLAARRQLATERLAAWAGAIGKQYGLEATAAALQAATAKDPQVRLLYQLEAAADLMEAIGRAVGAERDAKASPAAKEVAQAEGVDLADVEGTGRGGIVVKADVLAAAGEAVEAAPKAKGRK